MFKKLALLPFLALAFAASAASWPCCAGRLIRAAPMSGPPQNS